MRLRHPLLKLVALLFSLPLINLLLYRARKFPRPAHVQIVAHRGGAALAPENSEAAFRNAAKIGADWIEFDVHRTSDGVLVIMHDDTVNRMTNGKGYIKDMSWAQIRQLRMVNGEMIMRFDEVIALAKEMGMGILPELKSTRFYPGMEIDALRLVQEANYQQKTVFLSFDWDVLTRIKQLAPEVKVAALYSFQWDVTHPQPSTAEIVAPMAEMVVLNPWMIPNAHRAGREVWVWFGLLDHPHMYRLMLALGVDALICNDPAAAIRLAHATP